MAPVTEMSGYFRVSVQYTVWSSTCLTASAALAFSMKVTKQKLRLYPVIGSIISRRSQIEPHFSNSGISWSSNTSFGIRPQNTYTHNVRGAFTCVRWQVTLCDPIWQVTSHSSKMGSHEELYRPLPFFTLTHRTHA